MKLYRYTVVLHGVFTSRAQTICTTDDKLKAVAAYDHHVEQGHAVAVLDENTVVLKHGNQRA